MIREMFVHTNAYDIFKLYPSMIFTTLAPMDNTLRPIAIMLAIITNNSDFIVVSSLGKIILIECQKIMS